MFLSKAQSLVPEFPMAAVTNYQKLGGLKQYIFTLLQFWRSEVGNQLLWAKIRVSAGHASSRGPRGENPFPGIFQLLEPNSLHSLVAGPFLQLQSQQSSCYLLPLSSNLLLPLSYKDTCDCIKSPPRNLQ